jgi:alkanesulfonate monooxygenase SsuD/methylene tetrahydromethanopterin reductase-like flavin-dependent oxidoreductase (luciferase family)
VPFSAVSRSPEHLGASSYEFVSIGFSRALCEEEKDLLFGAMDHLDLSGQTSIAEHYESRLRLLELYDEFGFYAFHTTEHHCTPLGGGAAPSVFLAAAAQRTKRLRLGTLVYVLPACHPIRLVEEIGMVDQLSNGRLELGFGRGSVPMELDYLGVDSDQARSIYDEALECVIQGLRDGLIDFQGRHFSIRNAPIFQRPLQKPIPPVWYGVHSIESARTAAENGFNIVCNEPAADSGTYISHFKDVCAKTRPNEQLPKIGLARTVVVGETTARARTLAERAHAAFQKSFRFLHTRHGVMPKLTGREANYEELEIGGRGIAGTPNQVLDFALHEMTTTGANYLVMRLAFGDMTFDEMASSVRLFAMDVAPNLRGLTEAEASVDQLSELQQPAS